jgi:hypothetical protein
MEVKVLLLQVISKRLATVTLTVAVTGVELPAGIQETVIFAVPGATPLITPSSFTVATDLLSESYEKIAFSIFAVP